VRGVTLARSVTGADGFGGFTFDATRRSATFRDAFGRLVENERGLLGVCASVRGLVDGRRTGRIAASTNRHRHPPIR
jgi:hypothetical protein